MFSWKKGLEWKLYNGRYLENYIFPKVSSMVGQYECLKVFSHSINQNWWYSKIWELQLSYFYIFKVRRCLSISFFFKLFSCNCAIWQLTNYWSVKWAVEIDWHFKEELNNRKKKFCWHVTNCYSLPSNLCCCEINRHFK